VNRVDWDHIETFFTRSVAALQNAATDSELIDSIGSVATAILKSFALEGKLLIAGNGGSAADAQHLAAEFLSRFASDRRPLPCIALTTDTSVLTAIGNDYGFDHVFARQLRGLAKGRDTFLAISTSGRSPNVIAALEAARDIGVTTVGFTGLNAGRMRELCDFCIVAPSTETAIIQQIHIVSGHIICGLVERALLPAGSMR
jgi:D-sedoheptulose 7-phosphate isomerase